MRTSELERDAFSVTHPEAETAFPHTNNARTIDVYFPARLKDTLRLRVAGEPRFALLRSTHSNFAAGLHRNADSDH